MVENIIKDIQKKISSPFTYNELIELLDKKMKILGNPSVQNKIPDNEYCALLGSITDVKNYFKLIDIPSTVSRSTVSVTKIYIENLTKINHDLFASVN